MIFAYLVTALAAFAAAWAYSVDPNEKVRWKTAASPALLAACWPVVLGLFVLAWVDDYRKSRPKRIS